MVALCTSNKWGEFTPQWPNIQELKIEVTGFNPALGSINFRGSKTYSEITLEPWCRYVLDKWTYGYILFWCGIRSISAQINTFSSTSDTGWCPSSAVYCHVFEAKNPFFRHLRDTTQDLTAPFSAIRVLVDTFPSKNWWFEMTYLLICSFLHIASSFKRTF